MTVYTFLSSVLSYVFTVIIYLFIFSVIRLIYLDVRKMSRFETNNANDIPCASLKAVKSKVPVMSNIKGRYAIYGYAEIGRAAGCDIQIQEDYISGKHARIWYEDGEWYLEDLGSRNGTFVNNQRIQEVVILDPEDVISFDGLNFVFEL